MNIPLKVSERLAEGLKKFQPIIKNAKARDINESDTVTIVGGILNDIFGFDQWTEITSEFKIQSTYCDLAIKIDGKIKFLIEVKAINKDLSTQHISQAVNYGANAGADWVILTNGSNWRIYKIIFGRPVANELVYEFNLLEMSSKKTADMQSLFMVTKESLTKSFLEDYHNKKNALSKFSIGHILTTEPVLDCIRKSLKKMNPEIKIDNENIQEVLQNDVIKREIFEGEKSDEAKKKIMKFFKDQGKENKPPEAI